jgi:hypothetical protein
MILLPVDEAYALDYLAILFVKRDQGLPVEKEINRVEVFLGTQVTNLREVLKSVEFIRLMIQNEKTFVAIEAAHSNHITAKEVQEVNHARFLAKRALQSKFWPNIDLEEQKTSLTKRR